MATKTPELIAPAKPTPHGVKLLSDIDNQEAIRHHVPVIQFYQRSLSAEGKDPAKVIRDSIAKALVSYYPLAGRLRESADKRLAVECTGEGVVFVEADADVALQQLGPLYPPFPYLDKLLYNNVPAASTGVVNCPLFLFQVTRLICGGFVVATSMNHRICDGTGLRQFLSAVGEFARGAEAPSVQPVWQRHLLTSRNLAAAAASDVAIAPAPRPPENLVDNSFLFSAADISALRGTLPPQLRPRCTPFEIAVACFWRCRTIALCLDPDEEISISCVMDCRKRLDPPLPEGYYGNAIVNPAAGTTAGRLSRGTLQQAVGLVKNAKSRAAMLEYLRGRQPLFVPKGAYVVSDNSRVGYGGVDFGWGAAAYGGPARCFIDDAPEMSGYALPCENSNEVVLTARLPEPAMEKFRNELRTALASARKSIGVSLLL